MKHKKIGTGKNIKKWINMDFTEFFVGTNNGSNSLEYRTNFSYRQLKYESFLKLTILKLAVHKELSLDGLDLNDCGTETNVPD